MLCQIIIENGEYERLKISVLSTTTLPGKNINRIGCLAPTKLLVFSGKDRFNVFSLSSLISPSPRDITDEAIYIVDYEMEAVDKFQEADLYRMQIIPFSMHRKLYLINHGKLLETRIISYKEFLDALIDDFKWLIILPLCLEIYAGKLEYLGDIPNTQERRRVLMLPYFTIVCCKLIDTCYRSAEGLLRDDPLKMNPMENGYWEGVAKIIVRFHVELEAFDSLFYNIKSKFKEYGHINEFYDSLAQILTEGSVKWAPSEDIKQICVRYLESGRTEAVQQFLLNLNSEAYDSHFLIATCIEKGLFLPLIAISTDKGDFTTPAITLYKSFCSLKGNMLEVEQYNENAYRCLWYFRMILSGRCLKKELSDHKMPDIIIEVSQFYLIDEVIADFLRFDFRLTYSVYKKLFEIPTIRFLESPQIYQVLGANKSTPLSDVILNQIRMVSKKLAHSSENFDDSNFIDKEDNNHEYYEFVAGIMSLEHINFEESRIQSVIHFFIDKIEESLRRSPVNHSDSISFESKTNYFENIDDNETELVKILRTRGLMLSKDYLLSLEARLQPDCFPRSYAEICFLRHRFFEGYEVLFGSPNKIKRATVYDWIRNHLERLILDPQLKLFSEEQDSHNYLEEMKSLIISETKNLVAFNSDEANLILSSYLPERHMEAVRELDLYPNIQLDFIHSILKHQGFNALSADIRLIYLEVLCKSTPFQVEKVLEEFDFPLQEALEICRKKRVKAGEIIILGKLGHYREAINLMLTNYRSKPYLRNLSEKKLLKDLERIKAYFEGFLHKTPEEDPIILEFSLSMFSALSSNLDYSTQKYFRALVVKVLIGFVFLLEERLQITTSKPPEFLRELIQIFYDNLTFDDLRGFLATLIVFFSSQAILWEIYDKIQESDSFGLKEELLCKVGKGNHNIEICSSCGDLLQNKLGENLKALPCIHAAHLSCLKSDEEAYLKSLEKSGRHPNSEQRKECLICYGGLGRAKLSQTHSFIDLSYFYDVNSFLKYNADFVINATQAGVQLTTQTSKVTIFIM